MSERTYRIGSIAGIEIRIHASALFLFGVLTCIISYGLLPRVTPQTTPGQALAVGLLFTALLFGSVLAHELGHAIVAKRRGKVVAGVTMTLLSATAHIAHGDERPADDIAIGAAGPAVSTALAILFGVGAYVLTKAGKPAGDLLGYLALANGLLGGFNWLPGLPMDGGRVVRGVLWRMSGNAVKATRQAALAGKGIAILLGAVGCWVAIIQDPALGIWACATAWFLAGLADGQYKTMIVRIALDGLLVRDLYAKDVEVLQTTATVEQAAAALRAAAPSRSLPVLFGERAAGCVGDDEVASVPLDRAGGTNVTAVMTRVADLATVAPDDDAMALLPALAVNRPEAVIVEDAGTYGGYIRREDVARLIARVEASRSRSG
jgi:Zn-dependent protease/predicted transcriptional regulator